MMWHRMTVDYQSNLSSEDEDEYEIVEVIEIDLGAEDVTEEPETRQIP